MKNTFRLGKVYYIVTKETGAFHSEPAIGVNPPFDLLCGPRSNN